MADLQFESVYLSQRFIDMFNEYARSSAPLFELARASSMNATNSNGMNQLVAVPKGEMFGLVGAKKNAAGDDLLFVMRWVNSRKAGLLFSFTSMEFVQLFDRMAQGFIDKFISDVFTKQRMEEMTAQREQIMREEREREERERREREERQRLGYGGW